MVRLAISSQHSAGVLLDLSPVLYRHRLVHGHPSTQYHVASFKTRESSELACKDQKMIVSDCELVV